MILSIWVSVEGNDAGIGQAAKGAVLVKRIKEIAETRVRYGYRRIHVLLRREGWLVNAKRVCRLYRAMGLQLRSKSPKRRVKAQLREGRSAPTQGPSRPFGNSQPAGAGSRGL